MSSNTVTMGSTNMDENVEGYYCTYCGGKLNLNDDEPIIYCENCRKAYISSSYYGLEKYYSPSALSDDDIWKKVKNWFSYGAKDLVENAQLTEIKTIFMPIWRTVTETRTVACGYNVHEDSKGKKTIEYIKRLYKRDFTWDELASDGSEYGISSYTYPKTLKPIFEAPEDISLVPVTSSETTIKDRSTASVAESAKIDAISGMDEWTFYHIFPILKSIKIVYLPYAIVKYSLKSREIISMKLKKSIVWLCFRYLYRFFEELDSSNIGINYI